MDLTQVELCTLFGALAWSFNISPKLDVDQLPWYEVNPYVITMAKPFPVNIEVRSESKRRYIMEASPDAGYTLKEKKEDRWDQTHIENGKPWDWQGLAPHYEVPAVRKVYPAGA